MNQVSELWKKCRTLLFRPTDSTTDWLTMRGISQHVNSECRRKESVNTLHLLLLSNPQSHERKWWWKLSLHCKITVMKIKQTMNNIPACGEDLKASPNQKVTTKKVLSLQASFKKRKKSRKLYTLQRHCLHPSVSLCDVFRLKKPVGLSSKTLDKSFDLLIKFLLLSAFDISGKLYPLATTKKKSHQRRAPTLWPVITEFTAWWHWL